MASPSIPKFQTTRFLSFGKALDIASSRFRFHADNSRRFSVSLLHLNSVVLPLLPFRHRPFSLSHLHLRPLPWLPSSPPLSSMTTHAGDELSRQSDSSKTVRVVIKGRVQGVFYRDWTVENAKQLGLKGWVRNRRDGSVEALFSGSPEIVDEMQQRCRRGPPAAFVTGLDVFPSNDDPGTGFERRSTA
ncbi:PREDICTED: uncharacterized protein LOC104823233 [Tarenaya hassleriana]|uniref:uncharacterized protein LOC104823233 n=1 Tax=Tarenaya hassleriana TaxID=28532 RepID=UPI00053C66E3|nr:PREDICTED: uncharacterized protein LOC104823233 [Tarenaya hassleriana]